MQGSIDPAPSPGEACFTAFRIPDATIEEISRLPAKAQLRFVAWLRLSGQIDRAEELLDSISQQFGDSAALLDEQAALALARGDVAATRSQWEYRLERYPAPSARAAFARALLELGALNEAVQITEELMAEHGELATVRSLAADIALQQGDIAAAHDYWFAQWTEDDARVTPMLALTRIALLGGDPDEARSMLARALTNTSTLTPAQLSSAAGLAELLAQPTRAQALRIQYAQLEVARVVALATEINSALGRSSSLAISDHEQESRTGASDSHGKRSKRDGDSAPELQDLTMARDEESLTDGRVLTTLREVFNHQTLLPGQAAVINRVLSGIDTLAILPTGAGKSLTFQLSSLLLPGTTLVLSPLIALMKDQVEGLPSALRERTALINSTLTSEEQRRALENIADGAYKLVYAAPERLRQHAFLRALHQAGVSLVVVDEAHCISLWGHDFRPDYLSIPAALPELGNPPLLAVTATASDETASSLSEAFRRDLDVVRTSFFRSNLFYAAEKLGSKEEKARRVVALCREFRGQGIVYVSSRRDAENLAGVLGDNGVRAVPYHAGLEPRLRSVNQDRFMRGDARIVVATVAFGMGVDKPDIRFIIHFSPSTSLEAYAQESGRAGRDGNNARCVLLYTSSDRATQTRLAQRDAMDLATLRRVYAGIKRLATGSWAIFDPSSISLSDQEGADSDESPDPRIGIGLLVAGKLMERHPNAPVTWTLTPNPDGHAVPAGLDEENVEIWRQLADWAGLDEERRGAITLQTAEACDALRITPETLARVLEGQPRWNAEEGPRLPCLQLLPVEANAGARLQQVLDTAAHRARDRVNRTMVYAEGRRCRHMELAAHLGERLPPCGDACDVCTGEAANAGNSSANCERQPRKRTTVTSHDALVLLQALASAPFSVGKTGLIRLLEGSVQSRIQGDRSPYFGVLSDLQKSKIDGLIDRLVEDGFLLRDLEHEFKLIRLTERGAAAEPHDLIAYDESNQNLSVPAAPVLENDENLSVEDEEALRKLQAWRRERAERDAVPAYVVAHNSALLQIARLRPDSVENLAKIKGYGPVRAEKYGEDILAVIGHLEATDPA